MTREEWIKKYAEYMNKKIDLDYYLCVQSAEAALENIEFDLDEDPQDVADDDMSCWSD